MGPLYILIPSKAPILVEPGRIHEVVAECGAGV
jgi:hypothetical protein